MDGSSSYGAGMADSLRTARLWLRPWTEPDIGLLRRLSADSRVVAYIGDGRRWPEARVVEVSRVVAEHWRLHDFGWRVIVAADGERGLGIAMLNYLGDAAPGVLRPDEFEIGWWLDPPAWGRGVATEAAQALLDDALGRLRAPSVVARIQPENQASLGVARRLGMRHELDTAGRFGEPVSIHRLRLSPRAED
jgi:RimJ/RimL family protein N-acetyltransferase